MLTNGDIQQVFKAHVTKYQQRHEEKDWRWSCACGQSKLVETRDACMTETNNHWAGKIIEMQPTELPGEDHHTGELQGDQNEMATPPKDLAILSHVIREVDCERLTMPQGRHMIGEWFNKQDQSVLRLTGPARMRRLMQIAGAVNEEFLTLYGSLQR